MKKLTLSLEDLTVDSFDTAARRDGGGTVFGHTDRHTDCWGLCGVATDDGENSDICTQDPAASECFSNYYETKCMATACEGFTCELSCEC